MVFFINFEILFDGVSLNKKLWLHFFNTCLGNIISLCCFRMQKEGYHTCDWVTPVSRISMAHAIDQTAWPTPKSLHMKLMKIRG